MKNICSLLRIYFLLCLLSEASFSACTDVKIDYAGDGEDHPDWTANVWYTPCNAPKGSKESTYWAHQEIDNHLSIETGTRLRIGAEGTASNYMDETPQGPTYDITCYGTMYHSGWFTGIWPNCSTTDYYNRSTKCSLCKDSCEGLPVAGQIPKCLEECNKIPDCNAIPPIKAKKP